jgi:hypothetical protein
MEERAMKNLLTVVFAALALLVVPTRTLGQQLNDSQEPGSVLVFPKFLRGSVQTEQGTLPRTEIEISVTCPTGATCTDGQTVILRAHWVCPGDFTVPCRETDFAVRTTVRGSLWFNPEGMGPANASVPRAPCEGGYLILWVVNSAGQPIKFDALIGDAVIREGPNSASAYNAIPIQATSGPGSVPIGSPVPTGPGGQLGFTGNPPFYKAVTGTVTGTVRYDRIGTATQAPIQTSLTLLTLDVRSNDFNFPTVVDLDFFSGDERLFSTFTYFFCWQEVRLRDIDPALTETFMQRKGLVQSTEAEKVPFLGNAFDVAGPVTLLGLIETSEFSVAGPPDVVRGYMYSMYNDSRPVPTTFFPR